MAKGKLYFAKIDVKKINKAKIFKGEKGSYLDLTIWINDDADNYGNTLHIQQSTKQDEEKIYLGDGKEYQKAESTSSKPSNKAEEDDDDLPF